MEQPLPVIITYVKIIDPRKDLIEYSDRNFINLIGLC